MIIQNVTSFILPHSFCKTLPHNYVMLQTMCTQQYANVNIDTETDIDTLSVSIIPVREKKGAGYKTIICPLTKLVVLYKKKCIFS